MLLLSEREKKHKDEARCHWCATFLARAQCFSEEDVSYTKMKERDPDFDSCFSHTFFCSSQHNTTYVVHTYMPSTFLLQVCKIPHRITLPRIVRSFVFLVFLLGLQFVLVVRAEKEKERRSRSTRDYFGNRKRRHEDIRSPSPEQGARR